jgi:hypothetical protein
MFSSSPRLRLRRRAAGQKLRIPANNFVPRRSRILKFWRFEVLVAISGASSPINAWPPACFHPLCTSIRGLLFPSHAPLPLQPHGYPRTLRHSIFALQDSLAFHGMRQNFGRNIPRNQERQLVRRAPIEPPFPPCCANLTPPSAAASLPHIRVWYDGHVYVSENNRRLFVFKRLESEVLARILRTSPSTLNKHHDQGLLHTVPVRIERVKALTKTYVSEARIEKERVKAAVAGDGAAADSKSEVCS